MRDCTSLLRDPTILSMGLPSRLKQSKGFTRDNIRLSADKHSEVDRLYNDVNDPNEIPLLKRLLEMVIAHEDWLRYFDVESLSFRWTMGKHRFDSSNPYLELCMRCLTRLLGLVNGTSSGKLVPTNKDIEVVLEAMNLSLMGLCLCQLGIPADGPLQSPALICPPFLRESHSQTFQGTDTRILPGVTVVLVRCLTHTLIAETWMAKVRDSIENHLNRDGPFAGYAEVKDYYECIGRVTEEVLMDQRNPLRQDEQYVRYVESRLNPKNRDSDVNRLFALANVLALEKPEVTPGFMQYLVRLYPGFSPEACNSIRMRITASWPSGEKENGRLRPKHFTPFQGPATAKSREDWASAMQQVVLANSRREHEPDRLIPFEIEPIKVHPEYGETSRPDTVTVSDTEYLLRDEKPTGIRPMKCFCCLL